MSEKDLNDEWARLNVDKAVLFASEALKACLVLHGGASVAVFSLMATSLGKTDGKIILSLTGMRVALACFSAGLVLATAALMVGYFSQLYFAKAAGIKQSADPERAAAESRASCLRLVGVVLFCVSVALFIGGVGSAGWAFRPVR